MENGLAMVCVRTDGCEIHRCNPFSVNGPETYHLLPTDDMVTPKHVGKFYITYCKCM